MANPSTNILLNAQKAIDANITAEAGRFGTVEDGQVIELDDDAGTVTLSVEGGQIVGAVFDDGSGGD